jgi:hypothetical protein
MTDAMARWSQKIADTQLVEMEKSSSAFCCAEISTTANELAIGYRLSAIRAESAISRPMSRSEDVVRLWSGRGDLVVRSP